VAYSSAPGEGHCCTDVGHKATGILKTGNGRVEPLYSDYFHPPKTKKERKNKNPKQFYLTLHLESARRP